MTRTNGRRHSADPDRFLELLFGPSCGGSAERPWKVLEWAARLQPASGAAFWVVVLGAWSSFDRIPHGEFSVMFAKFADHAPSKGDVPEHMTVYRGQDASASIGLSWTLDRSVAEGFAQGHRGLRNPNPVVLTMQVVRGEVAFCMNDRNESEVVLMKLPGTCRGARTEASDVQGEPHDTAPPSSRKPSSPAST